MAARRSIAKAGFIKPYPASLPHSNDAFTIDLLPLNEDALETFLKIERPARPHAPPEADRYHTIGQFYEAVEEALPAPDQ